MMSVSQFLMAVLQHEDNRRQLRVCGTLVTGEGRNSQGAEIYVVVHQHTNDQGVNIAKGHGHYEGVGTNAEGDSITDWDACVEAPLPLSLGRAMGTALAVVERENPAGFTTQTWIEEFDIKDPDQLTLEEKARLARGDGDPCAKS